MLQNLTTSILNRFKGDGLEARVLQDTGSSLILKTSGMGVSFLLQLLLARVLGVEEYGNYIYVITWMITLSIFGTLGESLKRLQDALKPKPMGSASGTASADHQVPEVALRDDGRSQADRVTTAARAVVVLHHGPVGA